MKNNPKKIQIIRTAIKCVAQYGIESTSAETIAKKMGIAQSGIFYYFPTQEDLFNSLDGFIAQTNHAVVTKYHSSTGAASTWEKLTGHLNGNLEWAKKYPDQVCALLIAMAKTSRSRSVRQRVNKLFQVGEDRIAALLAEGIRNREFIYRGDITELACFVHKSLTGILIAAYYSRHWRETEFFQSVLQKNLAQLLNASVQNTKPPIAPRSRASRPSKISKNYNSV